MTPEEAVNHALRVFIDVPESQGVDCYSLKLPTDLWCQGCTNNCPAGDPRRLSPDDWNNIKRLTSSDYQCKKHLIDVSDTKGIQQSRLDLMAATREFVQKYRRHPSAPTTTSTTTGGSFLPEVTPAALQQKAIASLDKPALEMPDDAVKKKLAFPPPVKCCGYQTNDLLARVVGTSDFHNAVREKRFPSHRVVVNEVLSDAPQGCENIMLCIEAGDEHGTAQYVFRSTACIGTVGDIMSNHSPRCKECKSIANNFYNLARIETTDTDFTS